MNTGGGGGGGRGQGMLPPTATPSPHPHAYHHYHHPDMNTNNPAGRGREMISPSTSHPSPYNYSQDPGGSGPGGGGGGGRGFVPSPISLGSLADKLRVAASKGQVDKVQDLLQAGAGFEPDRDGRTALHYAAQNGYVDTCKLLIEKGCELDVQDAMGYTALLRACSQGLVDVVHVCLEAGCNVDFADEHGNTALHEAAWHGFSKTVELLIKYNANVFRTNQSGFTALHLGAQNGHNESSRVLLYGGVNSDLQNNYGDTALHTAARYGHAGVTRILISAKCKLNVQNKNGDTALHIAAALKRRKIAKILVESHVDLHVKNKQNETAVDVARRKEHPEIILIINSLSRPHSTGPKPREVPGVTFKDDIDIEDGPVVCPDDDMPMKPERQEKERGLFSFFKKKKKDKEKEKASQSSATQAKRPVPPGKVQPTPIRPVAGFFSQYVPRQGTQYYRDLAGNVKQGPVGYTPVCQCGPALHQLEKTMHHTKEELYEHIDASHQVLQDRIQQLDIRTSQQAHSLDHLTRERLEAERRACKAALEERLQRERHHTNYVVETYNEGVQTQVQGWLEDRLASYGHCLDHHHDDSALPPRHIFSDIHLGPDGGRLFRSRSDETLSVSDYSGKGRKRQFYESRKAAMEQIRGWKVPTGNKDSTRRRDRGDRGRSADNLLNRDVVQSRERNNNTPSHNNRNQGMAASTGNVVTMAEVHSKPHDRVADGASPKYQGEGLLGRQADNSGYGPGGRQTPSYGAVPKRSLHFSPQPQTSTHPHSSLQAHSHGNLTSRSPNTSSGASPNQPSQYPPTAQPRRGILRSRTDEGGLNERARSSTRQQPNLDERGPLGENIHGLNPAGREGPLVNNPAAAWRGASTGNGNGNQQHNPLYGNAQSVQDTDRSVAAYGNMDVGDSQRYRSRTRSTDAVLDGVDGNYSSVRVRSRSEERVLDCPEGAHYQSQSTAPAGDYSGYVTDSGMRRSYHDHSNQQYNPYRPVSQQGGNPAQWSGANVRSVSDERNGGRFVSGDRSDVSRPGSKDRTPNTAAVQGYGNVHRPLSAERTSGYFTDSDVKRSAQGGSFHPSSNSPYATPQYRPSDQPLVNQSGSRYRVLPPLPPPKPVGNKPHPPVPPKPTVNQSTVGSQSVYDRSQSIPPTAKENLPNSSMLGGRSATGGSFGVQGPTTENPARRPSETATPMSFQGYSYSANFRDKSPTRRTESPRELWESSRQLVKDKSANSGSVGMLHNPAQVTGIDARTPSPYQSQISGNRNSVSKSETNLTKVSDGSSPREPVSSGHYSVSNGCLRHESYSYSPVYNNGGSKEDSTCSSNQDSGYSSRMVDGQQVRTVGGGRGRGAESTTPSSSFSTDRSLSLGPPSNTSSPYMHMGGGNSHSDYVPMGRNSADLPSPRGINPYRNYPQGSSTPTPTASNPQQQDCQKMALRNPSSDYQPVRNATPDYQPVNSGLKSNRDSQLVNSGLPNGGPNPQPFSNPSQQLRSGTTPSSQPSSVAAGANVQKQVQGWYQRKLLEAAERLRNSDQYNPVSDNSFGSYTTVHIRYDPVHGSDV
ncbi:hypothetical protein V1264_016304 [Littorina saxatilis]|uniref:Ankyrin repeat domain-containing protein 6 n=2 Tax=Littorina saxatilis TaxID=31220 RepID=A0AAN9BRZ7_9CAEN